MENRFSQKKNCVITYMSYIVSWSGGKDCCYAYYKAIQEGYNITYLINLYFKRSLNQGFHKLDKKLIQLQAKSIEIPLIQRKISLVEPQ